MLNFTIPLRPITKKNSQRIVINRKTGKPYVIPSKAYKDYEFECRLYVPHDLIPIDYPVNVKALFYMPTRHRVDLVNLEEALCDILVRYGVLQDDQYKIVASMDGSRVLYDKNNPRTEVTITMTEVSNE